MAIELIVLDVDGTLTNGKITYTRSGDELKSFCVKDGLAISSWIRLGKEVAIITGRESAIVERRADELGIRYCYQGIDNKLEALIEILHSLNLTMENVASIGDDLNDMAMLKASKRSYVPKDASFHLRRDVDVVLTRNGGDAAVREMIEELIVLEGLEEDYLALWS